MNMEKKNIQDALYSYLMLYKKGLSIQDIIDNQDIFSELCKNLKKSNRNCCDINLRFIFDEKILFEISSFDIRDSNIFLINVDKIDFDLLTKMLFGQISCFAFLYEHSRLVDNKRTKIKYSEVVDEADQSWNRFLRRVEYKEEDFFISDEARLARKKIEEKNTVWCYNKSCTGKTFLGIYSLTYCNSKKLVFNPAVSNTCDIDYLKLLLEFGSDCGVLIDDLQCDIEFAKKLLPFVVDNARSIKSRNLHVFLISWSSLIQAEDFSLFVEKIETIKTKPQKFINMMKNKISDKELLDICGDNLALISVALKLKRTKAASANRKFYVKELFDYFVHTSDKQQLKIIHILAVLGTYEFETPVSFIKNFGVLNEENVKTAKKVGDSIFLAHRTISNFIARFIESECNCQIYRRQEIIKKYINYIDNRKKWKALLHLIGENNKTDILSVSPIWNLMYEFQYNLKRQTQIDPSWNNTPSSMYFVISTAKMLGVVDEYKEVIDRLCSNFSVHDNHVEIRYDLLQTTVDFVKIKERMIEEDKCYSALPYENGESIDLETIHRNWLYGLMIGLKDVLAEFGYNKLIQSIEIELLSSQDEKGYWYPKRVPWVSARILIGLAEAGYSIKDEFVLKGINHLLSMIEDKGWQAHTGGWNNEFETSSLCLEALIKCGVDCDMGIQKDVTKHLLESSSIWMSEHYEIDGATTACALLKSLGIQPPLMSYINELAKRNIHNILEQDETLDYNNVQSCKTTQIAYYVIELCWYILEKDISSLLDDFIARSEQEMEGDNVKRIQLFISYSEDSPYHIKKVGRIVEHLEKEGYIVYFYANAPLGTNNMEFMQKINECDATIVIGTRKYKEKSTQIKSGGAFFEACVLSREFMNNNYEKIIPVAFDEFNESFPEPFAINKGMRVKRVDGRFLNSLSLELKNKF